MRSSKISHLLVLYCIFFSYDVYSLRVSKTHSNDSRVTVAIVGTGLGGASTTYYLNKFKDNQQFDVTAFDANSYIGGRLKHIELDGAIVEVGGDAFASENTYLLQITKELGLQFTGDDNSTETVGVWDGQQFHSYSVWRNLISEVELEIAIQRFKLQLELNYNLRNIASKPFKSIEDFLWYGGVDEFTSQTSNEFAKYHHVDLSFAAKTWEPITRVIYDQPLSIQAFAGIVALLPVFSDNYSVQGGNSLMPEGMLKKGNAQIHLNTKVTDITLLPNGQYQIQTSNNNNDNSTKSTTATFDYVVIAAPIEHVGITFHNITLPPIKQRSYRSWYITIVIASGLNPVYFGGTSETTTTTVPDTILTMANTTSPFVAIGCMGTTPRGSKIYKISANQEIDSTLVNEIFLNVVDTFRHHWNYTFPILDPVHPPQEQFQPVYLSDHLLYLNGLESVATAMECSVIAGRNAAQIIASETMKKNNNQ